MLLYFGAQPCGPKTLGDVRKCEMYDKKSDPSSGGLVKAMVGRPLDGSAHHFNIPRVKDM
jgi:hypothetical protein